MSDAFIAVVRHGQTDWNLEGRLQGRTEVALNKRGRAQALATAKLLNSLGVRELYGEWRGVSTSPLGRARETADILATGLNLGAPRVEAELLERDFGPAEGLKLAEARKRWPGLVVPSSETREDLAKRTADVFNRLLSESPGSIAVAHGAMIRAGLSLLTGTEMPRIRNAEVWILFRNADAHRTLKLELDTLEPTTEEPK